ncbi:hypothetical protein ACGFXC_36855 [Streptomyces sp. NPDC048507]|uniref:VMAP-C domain-containing protein n=1 Tax=Streptomyces sp. NPDC048507 TaxID=3365560 RepID=UPI00371247C2
MTHPSPPPGPLADRHAGPLPAARPGPRADAILPAGLSPARTFALVAGVETYEISRRWNLRGPARDALRFARWLTGPGEVPAANVRLLLSPLDGPGRLDWSGLAALRDTCRPATEENAETVLLDELPQCNGDLLWIFWAGHGYLDHRRELMLPCADARSGRIRHLNLDSALRWWQTDLVAPRRFPLQAALVDACRVDAPRDTRWNFGSADYGGGATVPGRRQFRLYASREGEAAGNDAERGAGRFTDALLAELGGRSVRDGALGLRRTARTIHRTFGELRERGEGWQLPQFIVHRDWDANSFLDDQPPVPALPRTPRLDQTGWDGLGGLFEGRGLPRCAYEAYAWAFKAAGCTTPVHGALPADTLLDLVWDLDQRQGGPSGLPLPVPFVHYLADRARRGGPGEGPRDPHWAAGLAAWVRETRERLALPALRPPPAPAARGTALHVRLETPDGDTGALLARIWRRRCEREELVWESGAAPVGPDAVRAALVRELALLEAAPGTHAEAVAGTPYERVERVRFQVPYELLEADFDQWPVPRGPGGRTRPLGSLYEVSVRCPQEREDTRAAWRAGWHWLCAQDGRHPDTVRVVADADADDGLGLRLGARPAPACVLGHTSAGRTPALLEAVLEGGVPVAVWRRAGPPGAVPAPAAVPAVPTASAADAPPALPPLTELLAPEAGPAAPAVFALPGRVREVRRAAAAQQAPGADRLVLLWDDPEDVTDHRSLA